jgi:hypothetical protein
MRGWRSGRGRRKVVYAGREWFVGVAGPSTSVGYAPEEQQRDYYGVRERGY